jgi:hypothetical protein
MLELSGRADRWALPDGSIQRFRSGLAYRPTTLGLHPERNGVRLAVEVRPDASASARVGTVQVHTPGPHLFLLEELRAPALTPARVVLTVREEVEHALMPLVWAGIAMLLAGVGWTTYRLVLRAT